jgi:hypothetical protein
VTPYIVLTLAMMRQQNGSRGDVCIHLERQKEFFLVASGFPKEINKIKSMSSF